MRGGIVAGRHHVIGTGEHVAMPRNSLETDDVAAGGHGRTSRMRSRKDSLLRIGLTGKRHAG